jgi:hypothetical protein
MSGAAVAMRQGGSVSLVATLDAATRARAAFVDFIVAVVIETIAKWKVIGVAIGVNRRVAKGHIFDNPRVTPRVVVIAIGAETVGT